MTVEIALKTSAGAPPASNRSLFRDEISAIVKHAATGKEECLSDVRDLLADPVVGADYRECVGSPALWLRQALIRMAIGKNVLGTLAQVRKLGVPAIQLNIAKNHVNVAASQS